MSHKDSHIVSVIVPTLGRDTLELAKQSLENQTRKPDEIILSFDEKFYGPAWPRNRGIERAKGDLIAIADDDCVYPPDWLERLITALDKYDSAGAGGTFVDTDSLLQDLRLRRQFPTEEGIDTANHVGNGGNILYRVSYLKKLKEKDGYYFDETIRSGQDIDFASRISHLGGRLVFVPSNPNHLKKVNFRKFLKLQFVRGIGIAQLHHKSKHRKMDLLGRGLLRKEAGCSLKRLWLILWRKGLGPFDFKNFSSPRNYLFAWVGQKAEMIGYAKETLVLRFRKR